MLQVISLTKKFKDITAVDNLSFEVKKGEVFGLMGENGAGKTTTLRILSTMLKSTSGTAKVMEYDLLKQPVEVRKHIGILFGGETGLYDRLSCRENIAYFGELNDMSKGELKLRIENLIKLFGMEDFIDRRAGKLSKGMKQKVAFARSIVHDPEIMLLDEPTSGLDVTTIRDVHAFIEDMKQQGRTIILSSHTMSEVEKLCDRIGIIHKGKLAAIGTIQELKDKFMKSSLEEVFVGLVGDGK